MAKEPRTKVVRLRLTPEEEAGVKAFAAGRNVTVSEAMRRLAREAGGLGPTVEREDRMAIQQLSVQLRAIGVNLNQMARALNAAQIPAADSMRSLLSELIESVGEVDDLYVSLCRKAVRRAERAVAGEAGEGAA